MAGKRELKKENKIFNHFKNIGFTNRLALYCVLFLALGLGMGFYLAIESIENQYVGSLVCFTAALAPIGTMISVVLGKVVDKNRDENTGGNGDGITFATAKASGFSQTQTQSDDSVNSPPI